MNTIHHVQLMQFADTAMADIKNYILDTYVVKKKTPVC